MVVAIIVRRVRFPYDLEWMEGGMVTHSLRILQGLPIYVEPSFEFTPFIYNPLFHVLGAGAIAVLGPGPLALRVVAVLFTGVLCVSLFELVRRETRNPAVSFLSVAALLATYELSGGWMDIGRPDTTFLGLQSLAVLTSLSPRRGAPLLAGALVVLGFFSKQYALVCAGPIALYLFLDRGWGAALRFCLTVMGCVGVVTAWLQWTSGGWYLFYTIKVPAAHAAAGRILVDVVRTQVLAPLSLLLILSVFGVVNLAARWRRHWSMDSQAKSEGHRSVLLLGYAAVLLVQAWYSYDHVGNFLNCLMPGHVGLALLAGCGLGATLPVRNRGARGPLVLALCVFSVQIYSLKVDPARWVPSPQDLKTGQDLEASLRSSDSPQLLGYRGYFGSSGTNAEHAHQMAVLDLVQVRSRYPQQVDKILREAEDHFATKPYSRVILDNKDYVFAGSLHRYYRRVPWPQGKDGTFWTPSGARMKPRLVYVPRN
jgi:hypothetical protein